MMENLNYTPKMLPYKYEFDKKDIEAVVLCNEQHGFAVVKNLLPLDVVEQLKLEVQQTLAPKCEGKTDATAVAGSFVELSPALAGLMTFEPYMNIVRGFYGHVPITLNLSAAIYKQVGAGDQTRLTCALSFRPKGQQIIECWPVPESA